MAQAKQDMGTGSLKKRMMQLMIPAVVAQVVNLLYNIVDRIYIGHIAGIGAAALTGVGLFTPILMLLNAFAMLVGAGGAPRTAIALGRGGRQRAEKIISNSFTVLMFFAVVLTIGFYAGAPVLLRLFGASDVTLPYALSYSRIYIAGSVFVLVVLGMNPFITTQGFAKTSMLTTVIGAVINIILDPILIFGFGLGVRGLHLCVLAVDDAVSRRGGGHFHLGHRTDPVHHVGHAHLHGGHFCHGLPDRLPAELYGTGAGQGQPAAGLPAQDHPADPAHLHSAARSAGCSVRRVSGRAGQRHSGRHHHHHHLLCPVR